MVNLKKWDEIQHADVRKGDVLKIVEVIKDDSPVLQTNIYRGKVEDIDQGDIYLTDGSVWEEEDPDEDETVTVYRRKAKPFVFPLALGAVLEGEGLHGKVELVHLGDGRWFSLTNTGYYGETLLLDRLTKLRVIGEGAK